MIILTIQYLQIMEISEIFQAAQRQRIKRLQKEAEGIPCPILGLPNAEIMYQVRTIEEELRSPIYASSIKGMPVLPGQTVEKKEDNQGTSKSDLKQDRKRFIP